MRTRIENANVFDPAAGRFLGDQNVAVEDDRIVEVGEAAKGRADRVVDARGRFLLPGFIDAHVHLTIVTMNFARGLRESAEERAIQMAGHASAMLRRGFTTARDTGGDTRGIVRAIDRGLCEGPRVSRAGRVLSQTGGHGDIRPGDVPAPGCGCQIVSDGFSHIVDAPDAVRKAARHELREGSDFLKIMSSGGVASPTDPFDSIQFTAEEIRAATLEAEHRHTYVTSHAYSPEAIRLAVDNGVRCIEHGNMIDAETARHVADLGAIVVPTLVTYRAMATVGEKLGLPARNVEKNRGVFEAGLAAIETLRAAGVELGFGTDLLGEAHPMQNQELAIRAEVEKPIDVLRSMWITNAKLCGMEGQVGTISPGAFGDLVLTSIDPLDDLAALSEPEKTLDLVVARGKVVLDRQQ